MLFAKPPGGFEWTESDQARAQLSEIFRTHPGLVTHWESAKVRLIHTAHREGERVPLLEQSNVWLFTLETRDSDPDIQFVFTLKGETLRVESVRLID